MIEIFNKEVTGFAPIRQGTIFRVNETRGPKSAIRCIIDIDKDSKNKPELETLGWNPETQTFFSPISETTGVSHIGAIVGQMDGGEVKNALVEIFNVFEGTPSDEIMQQLDTASKKPWWIVNVGE